MLILMKMQIGILTIHGSYQEFAYYVRKIFLTEIIF